MDPETKYNLDAIETSTFDATIEAGDELRPGTMWHLECRDKYGNLKWNEDIHNVVTNEGLDHILNVEFHGTTQITAWYVLLFNTNTTPSGTTTYASPVFTESTDYDEATRPAYVEAAASSQSMTNTASKAVFTISTTTSIYGAALVGGGTAATTKGDTAGGGTMFCAAKFSSVKNCVDDDTITVTIVISAADA
jgi:hypothetical protein